MEMEMLIKQLLEAELAKTQAAAAVVAPVAEVVAQKAEVPAAPALDMDALVAALTANLMPKLEEIVVAKAAASSDEIVREEGAGRVVGASNADATGEATTIDGLIAKASKSHKDLTEAEKRAVFNLTQRLLARDLTYGDE